MLLQWQVLYGGCLLGKMKRDRCGCCWTESLVLMLIFAVDSLESEADKAKRLAQAAKAVKKLGSKTVGNIFTHLRKVALHPLLVRHLFSEDQVAHMARIARQR